MKYNLQLTDAIDRSWKETSEETMATALRRRNWTHTGIQNGINKTEHTRNKAKRDIELDLTSETANPTSEIASKG